MLKRWTRSKIWMWVEKILRPGVKCVHIVFISILSGHWVGRSPPSNPPHTSESEEPWVVSALLYWFNIYSTLYILHLMLQTKFPGDPRQEGVTVERRTFKQQGKTSTRVLASLICPFLRPVSGRLVPAADGGELRLNVSIRHHRRLERITFVYSESDWEDVTTRQLHLAKRGRGTGAEYSQLWFSPFVSRH